MLSKVSRNGAKLAAVSARALPKRSPALIAPAVNFSVAKKSWVPNDQAKLMQITMKSLIAEVADQQRDAATKVSF
jgi:hypothetical protein